MLALRMFAFGEAAEGGRRRQDETRIGVWFVSKCLIG